MTTACESSSNSSDDMTPVEDATSTERPIGFMPRLADAESTARLTRAVGDGELTTELLQQKGFGVYCWYTGENNFTTPNASKVMLMQNQRVTNNGALWTYSPAKYWPLADNEKLTFRAYAPYVSYHLVETVESDPERTYKAGMPLLPVVVTKDDYHKGEQHDPLWGTGRLVEESGEYAVGTTYGQLYDNIKYHMSGDYRLINDTYDGTINWYFHHGMASLMFTCSVIADPGCEKVVIRSISVSPLYDMGLLDLSSPTANKDDKPWWYDRDGNMTVELKEGDTDPGDLAASPVQVTPDPDYIDYPFTIKTGSTATAPANLLDHGLLIIPRDYSGSNPRMVVTVKYTIDTETEVQTAIGYIEDSFKGNTSYKIGLKLTPATKGLEIELVQTAFTKSWNDKEEIAHEVYNW